jgi:hypothetical protein
MSSRTLSRLDVGTSMLLSAEQPGPAPSPEIRRYRGQPEWFHK